MATVQVAFNDFYLHGVGNILRGTDCNTASTHNHYIAYFRVMFLSGNLLDIRYVFSGSGEIHDVVQLDCVITSRNDGFISSFDGYDVERDVA